MGVSIFNKFSNFAHARVESKIKLVISDFLQNYFLLLKFLGKLFSGQTNSAVPRTGRQKLEKFRLCPLVGPRPTSPGVHPNYYLSFTTNVDRSFPNHLLNLETPIGKMKGDRLLLFQIEGCVPEDSELTRKTSIYVSSKA